jgi:hypothetical protein
MALAETERVHWTHTILQWKQSHQSAKAFCNQHALDLKIFHAWRKKLLREEKAIQNGIMTVPHFIPITTAKVAPTLSDIKLELRDGIRVCWQISGFSELAQQLCEMGLL